MKKNFDIGLRMMQIITEKKLKKIDVCKNLGISRPTLDDFLANKRAIGADKLLEFIDYAEIDVNYFFSPESKMDPVKKLAISIAKNLKEFMENPDDEKIPEN